MFDIDQLEIIEEELERLDELGHRYAYDGSTIGRYKVKLECMRIELEGKFRMAKQFLNIKNFRSIEEQSRYLKYMMRHHEFDPKIVKKFKEKIEENRRAEERFRMFFK